MIKLTEGFVQAAERLAARGASLGQVLPHLRLLDIDSFGMLLLAMPDERWPAISALLPAAPTPAMDRHLTGDTGLGLLQKSTRFVRSIESNYFQLTHRSLSGTRILDYGYGYGRLSRLMLRYTDPANIFGCDVAQRSLDWAREARLPGNYALIKEEPSSLPFGAIQFDLIYAFSVFTHLSENVTRAAIDVIVKALSPNGLLAITVRPIEFWQAHANLSAPEIADLTSLHERTGFAFRPHLPNSNNFGDTSLDCRWLRQAFPEFDLVGHDWAINDPHQIVLYLRPGWQFPRTNPA